MNPQEPVLPDPDVPVQTPSNPVEEPPAVDDVGSYQVSAPQPGRDDQTPVAHL
jgi:hypothetical protein